ncbi:hypothetical protein A2V82_05735 [candidate division KSB1 bacterium RBG_16_48_16]|nr:MAG: hypothetical protein A2V82_05735 [candidate division KSB1 bacterium RBG_16_48_16]
MFGRKNINRRQFLKRSCLTSGAILGLPTIFTAETFASTRQPSPNNRIQMGCIGLGGQGTFNMNAFLNNDLVQVVALCDVNPGSDDYDMLYQFPGTTTAGLSRAEQMVKAHYASRSKSGTFNGVVTYGDFRELLARDDIDAVTVCTPDHWHGLISIAAAKAGKDIYCEKPLVNTVAEGRVVCNAVKEHGRILQTGSHERSNDSVRYACDLVRNGRIGRLQTIYVNMPNSDNQHDMLRNNSDPKPAMPVPPGFDYNLWLGPASWAPYTRERCHFWWRYIMEYGGGEMTDRGAHIIDLAQLINDADDSGPVEIVAKGKRVGNGLYDCFIEYDFECTYKNGVKMIGSSKDPRGLKLIGTDGWIFIHIHGGRLEAEPPSLLREFIGPGEFHVERSPGHHQNFLDAVLSRKKPVAHEEIGHRTATICHLLNIAMETDRKLLWDPAREQITNDPAANRMLYRPPRSPWTL